MKSMSKKPPQDKWYNYIDINLLLKQKSNNNQDYIVIDAASQNDEQALQRVNEGYTQLESNHLLNAVVIPINLGNISQNIYQGSHWVSLVIRRNIDANALEALYNDSFGTPMDSSLPNLRQILKNHGILENNIKDFQHGQQSNDYDCGPLAVFNLDSLARTGQLSPISANDDISNQRNNLNILRLSLPDENQIIENISDSVNQQTQKITNDLSKLLALQDIDIISQPQIQIHKNEISTLTKQINNLTINSQSQTVKFIVNVPIYVLTDIDGDSPDESDDNTFIEDQFNFDVKDQISFPYRTFDIKEKINKSKKKEKSVLKKVIEHRVGSLTQEDLDLPLDQAKLKVATVSKSQTFLDLVKDTGFEAQDKDNLSNIKVSIGLNRPKSLSTRKNDSLKKQLHSTENNADMHEKFAFFWNISWTDNTGKPVEYCKVKHFYKQLKKKDLNKAEEFLRFNEDIERPTPP